MKLPLRPARVLPPWHRDGRGGSHSTERSAVELRAERPPAWVTGECWRCDGADLPVMWLGPVQSDHHGHAPFYACAPCVRRLEARIAEFAARRDFST